MEKANKFFNKLNEKENKEREEEQKEIETEYKNLMPVKIEKYFTIAMILFFIVLEIVVMVKSYLEDPIIEILVVGILLVVSEIWIIYKVGSENKKKRR